MDNENTESQTRDIDPALAAARRDQAAMDPILQELEELKKQYEKLE